MKHILTRDHWRSCFVVFGLWLIALNGSLGQAQVVFVWDAGGDLVSWDDPDNWFNAQFNDYPHFNGDTALVTGAGALGTGNPPILTESVTLGDMEIVSGGDVLNGLFAFFQFNVADRTFIGGTDSSLRLSNSPSSAELITNTLEINDTGTSDAGLILNNATAQVNSGVSVNSGGVITGNGTLLLNSTSGNIVNDGSIIVEGTDTLLIDGTVGNTGTFDWDGLNGNTAQLIVRDNATLDINLDQGGDAFGAEILLVNWGTLDNAHPWTLDTGGQLRFSGSEFTGQRPIVEGGQVTSRGSIEAIIGSGNFFASLQVTGGSMTIGSTTGDAREISVFAGDVFPAADLNFVKGTFRVDSAIGTTFTIDQTGKLFDWDGPNNDFRTFVSRNGRLVVDATQINPNTGASTTNRFAGELWVEGELTVNGISELLISKVNPTDPATFRFRGYSSGGLFSNGTSYQGVPLVLANDSTFIAEVATGSLRSGTIDAPVRIEGGTFQIDSGMTVIFADDVEFQGTSAGYSGNGTARFQGNVLVNAVNPLILPFATVFDSTSTTTIPSGRALNLTGPVTFDGNTIDSNFGDVNLFNDLHVSGGTTTVFVNGFDLNGLGTNTVTIDAGATFDLTGYDPDAFTGTLNIAGTFDYLNRFSTNGWTNAGVINLDSGTIVGGSMNHQGVLVVDGDSELSPSIATIKSGSSTTLNNATLTIGSSSAVSIEDGAGFYGTGTVVLNAVVGIGNVDFSGMAVDNKRILALVGEPYDFHLYHPVLVKAGSFKQSSGGEFYVMLGDSGSTPGVDFSQLEISADAQLSGQITIDLVDTYTPAEGDLFEIITTGNGVFGKFTEFGMPPLDPGLGWRIGYDVFNVTVEVIEEVIGDLNYDGFVGLDDLDVILANWNQTVPPGDARADLAGPGGSGPDGYVGLDDLDVILNNWNAGTPPSVDMFFAIPEPASAVVLGVGVWLFGLRRSKH